jgi:hypothetical protein
MQDRVQQGTNTGYPASKPELNTAGHVLFFCPRFRLGLVWFARSRHEALSRSKVEKDIASHLHLNVSRRAL